MPTLSEVFVAGGQPTFTYISRNELKLEQGIRHYLARRYRILSLSGPTKSGKTVLVRRLIPKSDAFWIPGGLVSSVDTFWDMLIEQAGAFPMIQKSRTITNTDTDGSSVDAGVKPWGVGLGGGATASHGRSDSYAQLNERKSPPGVYGPRILADSKWPVVIDDFHYIDPDVQLRIVRGLKDLVFDGLPVILLSVPHRAYDAVRVEREMTGRVEPLNVALWDKDELIKIADEGFSVLAAETSEAVKKKLASQSFGSPHLMQDFCAWLCLENGIDKTATNQVTLKPPTSWDDFFRARASMAARGAFERLAIGPRARTDRLERTLINGEKCDIYMAILLAIARTGPALALSYEQIRNSLREILVADYVPESNQIKATLAKMSEIARDDIDGEPVVDWDEEFSTLHISDPFFAFYLRWGTKLP